MTDNDDSKARTKDGERLFNVRTVMGLKQTELASIIGCTDRTIRNNENGVTKVSLQGRRVIGKMTGVDIQPLDPEEDPYLVLVQYREMQKAKKPTETPDQTPAQENLLARIKRFRVSSRNRLKNELTPARRAVENTIFTAYLTAAAVIAIELFQRSIGGWHTHQLYHDLLLAGSLITAFLLVIPAWLTTSWGTKPKRLEM